MIDGLRDDLPSAELVDGLLGRCAVLRNITDLEKATADVHTALDLARQIGYATGEAMALTELGIISAYAHDGDQAVEWARQAQGIDSDTMRGWDARVVESAPPFVLIQARHFDGALDLCAQVLAQARAVQDLGRQADTLYQMALLARRTRRIDDEARARLCESAEIAISAGHRLRLIDISR